MKNQPHMMARALLSHTPTHWPRYELLVMLATSCAYTMIGCGLYRPTGLTISSHTPSQAKGKLLNILVVH